MALSLGFCVSELSIRLSGASLSALLDLSLETSVFPSNDIFGSFFEDPVFHMSFWFFLKVADPHSSDSF